MATKTKKQQREEYLIRWRRKQVAEMTYENVPVPEIADKLKVNETTVYRDQQHNEEHADYILREYIARTVPNIINKSLYQIDLANREAIKILKANDTSKKEKLSAALIVAKTAKEVIDIITNNDDFVEAALELDETLGKEAEDYLDELSKESTESETEPEDTNAKF